MDTSWLIFPLYFYWAAGFLFGGQGILLFGLAHALVFAFMLWIYRSKLSFWRLLSCAILSYLLCGLLMFLALWSL